MAPAIVNSAHAPIRARRAIALESWRTGSANPRARHVDALHERVHTAPSIESIAFVQICAVIAVSGVPLGTVAAIERSRHVDARHWRVHGTWRVAQVAFVYVHGASRVCTICRPSLSKQ